MSTWTIARSQAADVLNGIDPLLTGDLLRAGFVVRTGETRTYANVLLPKGIAEQWAPPALASSGSR